MALQKDWTELDREAERMGKAERKYRGFRLRKPWMIEQDRFREQRKRERK